MRIIFKNSIQKSEFWLKDDVKLPHNFDLWTSSNKEDYIYKNKLLHKEDGPAKIISHGTNEFQTWYSNGKIHKINGPARFSNTDNCWSCSWFLNDILVDEEIYKKIQSSTKEDLLVYMIDPNYKDFLPLIEYELNKD